jgi:hypothetical protein
MCVTQQLATGIGTTARNLNARNLQHNFKKRLLLPIRFMT